MSKLNSLLRLESLLEDFLDRAADVELARADSGKSLESLGEIARESLRGRYIGNRLGDWFARNRTNLDSKRYDPANMTTIGNYLQDIKTGLDTADPESGKLLEEIDRWKKSGAVPLKKITLRRGPETDQSSITEEFLRVAEMESQALEYYKDRKMHLLTMLDDTLKAAEAKTDPAWLHLAGSMIFFLKMHGYKVDPYVKKLKVLEINRRTLKKDD